MRPPNRIIRTPPLPQILPARNHKRRPLLPNRQRINPKLRRALPAPNQPGPVPLVPSGALVIAAIAVRGCGRRAVDVDAAGGVDHGVLLPAAAAVVGFAVQLLRVWADRGFHVRAEGAFVVGVDDEDVLLAEEEGAVDDAAGGGGADGVGRVRVGIGDGEEGVQGFVAQGEFACGAGGEERGDVDEELRGEMGEGWAAAAAAPAAGGREAGAGGLEVAEKPG
ncbi:hypothetical protein V498_06471 [Pseudogymnoascus sp. VKM F-4517 (FW-2822)]|nr:hypothetical protein V498_06471 [Pseudogymnoascus sp. VKM F-4517 (FW-2822)]